MRNIIMYYFRRTNKYTPAKVASFLGISVEQYKEIENGCRMPQPEQTEKLGQLYKVDGVYFYEEAQQVEELYIRRILMNILRNEHERLDKVTAVGYTIINAMRESESEAET